MRSQVQPDLDMFTRGPREPKRGPRSRRGRAFVRLLVELQRLQHARYGVTLRALAEECGVAERTIRRDMEVFEEAGMPLVADSVNGSTKWRLFDRREVA
jgi:predicted DNA-binding transcriptional regulator YafY